MKRGFVFAAAAVALLVIDFALFPAFLEDRVLLEALPANRLVNGDLMTMGKYHLHTLRTSSGRIADESYMRKLGPEVNGLAMTVFSAVGTDPVGLGKFAETVMDVLPEADAERLRALIQNSPTFTPGKVQVLELQKPHASGPLSGIDVVLILRTKRGSDREAKEALRVGLTDILVQAGKHSVKGLLLPTLTVAPEVKESPSFDDFFRFLFESMHDTKLPYLIDVSFFDGWSTGHLENATAAFNDHWRTESQSQESILARVHRFQLRILLVGLAICFVVSARHMTLGAKSASILATSFAVTVLGSFKTVEALTEGLDASVKGLLLIVMMLFISFGFPHVVSWSVKDLFAGVTKNAQG